MADPGEVLKNHNLPQRPTFHLNFNTLCHSFASPLAPTISQALAMALTLALPTQRTALAGGHRIQASRPALRSANRMAVEARAIFSTRPNKPAGKAATANNLVSWPLHPPVPADRVHNKCCIMRCGAIEPMRRWLRAL